jgi:hypothetical protein
LRPWEARIGNLNSDSCGLREEWDTKREDADIKEFGGKARRKEITWKTDTVGRIILKYILENKMGWYGLD